MDSLTQIVLGGAVAAVVVPARDRRRALLAGAILGTLPDLDGIPLALMNADVVTRVTWHRGPSHSLPVLTLFAALLWLLLKRLWRPVRETPGPWLLAIWLALITHPLLDAFTVYGTQLWWPATSPPVMWSSVFIIDPLYTLPLLVAVVAAAQAGPRPRGRPLLVGGLVLSTAYLGWTLAAKSMVERAAHEALAAQGLDHAPRLSVPLPLNTLVWRVVVMTPEGFLEGERSLIADSRPMQLRAHASEVQALQALSHEAGVARLLWFTQGFMKAQAHGDELVLSDLRMGSEPDFFFRYRIAERDPGTRAWRAVPITAVPSPRNAGDQWNRMWHRLWHEPEALAPRTQEAHDPHGAHGPHGAPLLPPPATH